LLVGAPLAVILASFLTPTAEIWLHLWQTQLLALVWNTLRLMAGVGLGVLILGTGLAWLVTVYQFPGRSVFEWLLVLPLAIPAYVIGFVFRGLFDYTGPVQSALRAKLGPDAYFPEIASFGGVAVVMTLVLYPYVYLLARAAFSEQSGNILEAGRALGAKGSRLFWRVALPLARPSVAAGTALALMEALADFGTVAIYGHNTFTVAIYRIWFGMFNRHAATEIASLLLLFTLCLYIVEERCRGRARFYPGTGRSFSRTRLRGWRAWGATAVTLSVVVLSFALPVAQLVLWSLQGADFYDDRYLKPLLNTLALGGIGAAVAVVVSTILAYGLRLNLNPVIALSVKVASMGYGLPGSVVAVGVLVPLAALDHGFGALLDRYLGISAGLLFTGSMVGLSYAYLVRFLAVGYRTVEASLTRVTPSMDLAARSLGCGPSTVLGRVHLPLIRGGLSAAGILVFVDIMKEMPATLLLRPFGYDTLAVRVWQLTSESFWEAAALPALTIVVAGVLPVVILVKSQARPFWSAAK
jgi:iron(III) transport system permease protein